jgi:fructosamine-3-kinase
MKSSISTLLSAHLGGAWTLERCGASAFCSAWRARPAGRSSSPGELFVKAVPAAQASLLESEADGLAALAQADCIRTPTVAGCWVEPSADVALLAMEWLDLRPATGAQSGARFGRQLAALHGAVPSGGEGRFGWRRDNWIGGTPQRNRWSERSGLPGWLQFFADERLGAMAARLDAAGAAPALVAGVRRVIDRLPAFFDDGHVPRASLIHGDLWSGNWAALGDGTPVIFDPAVSVSDAEAELAMMELFGSPPPGFWPAYREVMPLHDGYARRRPLYQLYHLLNHALLFGGGYAASAQSTVERLLARA